MTTSRRVTLARLPLKNLLLSTNKTGGIVRLVTLLIFFFFSLFSSMDAVITQENGAYFRTLTKQVAGAERIDRQRIYPKKETILLTESDQNGKRISTRNKKSEC